MFFQQQGYDARVLKPEKPSELERASFACDVVFVGRWERERQRVAERIGRLGVKLAVWGPFWPRGVGSCGRNAVWRGEYVAGRDYALALSCSKIGLGLLSKLVPDQSTTRTVEIPACGTFLLAERTDEQLALFEEGSEAEYFSSDDECAAKIAFYLSHDDVRTRIAGKGFERCIRSGYSYRDRMSEVLQRIASARRETAK
ncbi:MAG TPA: glycosyltransferase [Planctomycetota bacterium]|nr:glycosyltransferase [Planctomycetota bacterium]